MFQTELDATLGAARGTSALKTAQQSLALPIVLLVIGFMVRLAQAAYRFLNPDEALHYLLGVQPSLLAAYNASLTTAHPPLLIVFLHYWGMMGHSELFLRLPSLLAGTAFCWIIFCWLRRVTNDSTALVGLILLLFSPALVLLSAEVRQYSLLLLFCAASLYWLDRAIQENSISGLLISSGALYLALLTH
jgi:predicted membrane-bound mannosyltransferase